MYFNILKVIPLFSEIQLYSNKLFRLKSIFSFKLGLLGPLSIFLLTSDPRSLAAAERYISFFSTTARQLHGNYIFSNFHPFL